MYLIDTNVMLAASSCLNLSALRKIAMPKELGLREEVFQWLSEFEQSQDSIVMDEEGLIRDEYERNMSYNQAAYAQEYGMQVLQNKLDRQQVEWVPIDISEENAERIALLEPKYENIVSDREDRKWVACALSMSILYEHMPAIVYAAETDWYKIEIELKNLGLNFQRLLPEEWYHTRVS